MSRCISIRASFSWMSWCSPIGLPKRTHVLGVVEAQLEAALDDPEAIAATPVRSIENASFAPSRYGTVLGLAEQPVLADAHVGRGTASRSATSACPSCASASVCSKPGMPLSSTKLRILRSAGGLPSSSLQMKTVVSAYGPFVMKVFEPLSRYSSPSRFALDCMRPNASEPESGSVIAQAPTLSNVSRSSAHRSFCAVVPRLMIVAGGEPDAHAHRGDEARASTGRAR